MTNPDKKRARNWPYLLLFGLIIAGLWFLTRSYINLNTAKQFLETIRAGSQVSLPLVAGAIIVAQIVGMALSLPTKAVFTIIAGALFAPFAGVLVTFAGVLTGTTMLFFGARKLFREKVEHRFGQRAAKLEAKLAHRPLLSIVGLRLMITLPYGPITLAAALTSIKYRDFLIGSVLGDLPVVVLYTLAGQRLASLTSASDALSPTTIVILILAGAILVIGSLAPSKSKG